MAKSIFYLPALAAFAFYGYIFLFAWIGPIDPMMWLLVAMMFVSAVIMSKNRWWGCLFGLAVGIKLIQMSMADTGQVIDIERPIGIIFCVFYIACGFWIYKKSMS